MTRASLTRRLIRFRRVAVVIALVIAPPTVPLVGAPVAHADDDAATRTAKRFFDRGETLFAQKKFDDALEQYEKAFEASPIPALLFNIGQCHRNLGDYESAIFSFRKYLKLEPEASNREEVQALIDDLEKQQAKKESKRLRIDRKRATDPEPEETEGAPVYKKWWFWTAVAVVGVGGGAGIYLATRGGAPDTSLGNIAPPP